MRTIGYHPCLADPDVWMKREIHPKSGNPYYAYILLYVDDVLCMHHNAEGEIRRLDHYFMMKPGLIGDPNLYLGAKLKKTRMPNGVMAWGMSSSKYVQQAIKMVQDQLEKEYGDRKLRTQAQPPSLETIGRSWIPPQSWTTGQQTIISHWLEF